MAKLLRHIAITFFILCTAKYVIAQDQNPGNCPPLWTRFQHNCYRFYVGPVTWASAELCCRESVSCNGDTSAHLASIHNQDENDFVYDYWQTSLAVAGCNDTSPWQLSTKALWIGLSDNETEGKFLWASLYLCATGCGGVCRGVCRGYVGVCLSVYPLVSVIRCVCVCGGGGWVGVCVC